MKLCLSCWRVSPAGSRFCAGCGKSLGCRVCGDGGHNAPLTAESCPKCGTWDLSDGVRSVSLAPVTRVLALLLAVWAWKAWILPNGGSIAACAGRGVLILTAFLTNSTPLRIREMIFSIPVFVGMAWFIGQAMALLPRNGGVIGRFLRDLPFAICRFAWSRLLPKLLRGLWAVCVRLVVPASKRGQGRLIALDGDLLSEAGEGKKE